MNTSKRLRDWSVRLAIFGMFTGHLVAADEHAASPALPINPATQAAADIALHGGGILVGAFIDNQGLPVRGGRISVQKEGKEGLTVSTDEHGRFKMEGLSGGVYEITTSHGTGTFRLWAPGTAPPAARQSLLLVTGDGGFYVHTCCDEPTCSGCCQQGKGMRLLQNHSPTLQMLNLGIGIGGLTTGIVALSRPNRGS